MTARVALLQRRGAAPVVLFLLTWTLLTVWALATARYGGPDEPAHVLRAASVARGEIIGDPVDHLPPGYRMVTAAAALTTGDPACFRHDPTRPATCARADPDAHGDGRAASSAGTYPPYYYALVGVPTRLIGGADSVLWYRIVAAGWCAVVLAAALWRGRDVGGPLLVAAVPPAAWFLFGVVNPNSIEVTLALLAWIGVERCRRAGRVERADAWWISVPLAVAILMRPVGLLAALAVLGALAVLTGRSRARGVVVRCVAPPFVAVVAGLVWNAAAGVTIDDDRTAESIGWVSAAWRSFADLPETGRELVGSLGWIEFSAPWVAHIAWWTLLAGSGVGIVRAARGGDRRIAVAWAWVAVVAVCSPIVFETVFATSIGFIWQGRYTIATALGLVVVGLGAWSQRLSRRGVLTVAAAGTGAQVVTLWGALQRYSVGVDGSWWLRGASWSPPLPAWLLLALAAVVLCLIVGTLDRAAAAATPPSTLP